MKIKSLVIFLVFVYYSTNIFGQNKNVAIQQLSSVSKKDLLCKQWRLFQQITISDVLPVEIDTTTFPINAKPYQTYIFNQVGTYIKKSRTNGISSNDDRVNAEEGIWGFNQDSTRVGIKMLKYINANGEITNVNNPDPINYDYEYISKLSATELIFTFKMHGRGNELYIPMN